MYISVCVSASLICILECFFSVPEKVSEISRFVRLKFILAFVFKALTSLTLREVKYHQGIFYLPPNARRKKVVWLRTCSRKHVHQIGF